MTEPRWGRRKPRRRDVDAERHQERVDRARRAYEAYEPREYEPRWPEADVDPEAFYFGSWGDPEGSES